MKIWLNLLLVLPVCGQNILLNSHYRPDLEKPERPIYVVRQDYPTNYVITTQDTFDFPLEKSWKVYRPYRVWERRERYFDEKVVAKNGRLLEPDTLLVQRYILSSQKTELYRLSRHFFRIYRVQKWLGVCWNNADFFVGYPDDFMRTIEVRTDPDELQGWIIQKLMEERVAGKSKAK